MAHYHVDPIAIIGIGCRFPGNASDPKKFWTLLCEGIDAIIETPKDRWDYRRFYDPNINAVGKMCVSKGGFLKEKWEDFDAEFFHISPREANFLDPQQRLLLELTWEAMEDGGLVPDNLRSSPAGVFIGAFTTDWQSLHNSPYNLGHCGVYTGINASKTILSARLSHFFDLKGPCLTVDTACSSSLVAVHLACQSLWQKECTFAIAGGVNAMIIPETTIAMSKGQFLNPEGKCRSFDADARGYVRGEGGGLVILKPLSEALRDRDPIYALIRGIGINHDGYTQGIAKPNPEAQKDLIHKVLKESGVQPQQIHYVEAHGTGTAVGDPIEAMALDSILHSPAARSHPCFLGAVKSNLGHLEAAAGIAGLIKTALCLKHKKIPPNLHYNLANPNIPFEQYCLKVPTAMEDFPSLESPHYACVNSFGYGGTNAHAVLQSYEQVKELANERVFSHPLLFPFSTKSAEGLKDLASNYEQFLCENAEVSLANVAFTLSQKRSFLEYRLAVSAESNEDLRHKLQVIKTGEIPEGCVQGKILETTPRLVFVYTGMGPQWWGMGRQLMEGFPIFLNTLKQCDKLIVSLTGWSLIEELRHNEKNSPMDNPVVAQLANYCLQISLTALFKSLGVHPEAVVGHSIGEIAAAYAAGVLSLEEGILVSYHRSRLQSTRKDLGTMLAIGMGMEEAESLLTGYHGKISIAAENSQSSTTLAGNAEDLTEIADLLEKKNIYNRFLKVNIAYHSHQMDGLEAELLEALNGLNPKKSTIPLFSTVYGDECGEKLLTHNYWWENIRKPVLFSQAVQNIVSKGYHLFVEIGPHPVLASSIKEGLQRCQIRGGILASLNRKKPEIVSLMECMGGLYTHGFPLSWDKLQPCKGHFVRLPAYPWQKKPYWVESEESRRYRLSDHQHPMLSRKIKSPQKTWQVEINRQHFPWLEDHKVDGSIVFPAAAYVEAGLAIYGGAPCVLEDLDFQQVLTIPQDKESILQVTLDEETKMFKVHSLLSSDEWEWTCHASGKGSSHPIEPPRRVEFSSIKKTNFIDEQAIYHQFARQGLDYGPMFRGIKKLWRGDQEALAEIQLPDYSEKYHIHPALLDCALQTLIGAVNTSTYEEGLILPYHMDQILFHAPPKNPLYVYAHCTKQTKEKIIGDLLLCDESGTVYVQIKGLQCRLLIHNSKQALEDFLYYPCWEEKPLQNTSLSHEKQHWLIGFSNESLNSTLVESFKSKNLDCMAYSPLQLLSQADADHLIERFEKVENLNILLGVQGEDSEEKLQASEIQSLTACVNLVKALENKRNAVSSTLWIVTQGTQFVEEGSSINLQGSTLWGLGRVIRQECPYLRCRLVDIEANQEFDWTILALEAEQSCPEDEIAWRQKKRYAFKLKKKDPNQPLPNTQILLSSDRDAFSLELKTPGLIDSLFYKQIEEKPPSADEVRIQVHASSLNFKDLMKVLGMLDQNVLEETYFGASFGMECSGTILSLGSNVKKYQIGDQVCCFVPNTFQSHINVSAEFIYPILAGATLDEAPIYIPFITVLRALKDIAKLKKGETLLVHSATGAVGLAAIQYANFVGADIIATAGNENKRNYLRSLGIEKCADSRSSSFFADILEWTKGRGVDVVLNSLSGDALTKSWALLAPYGRFIEIGKRDISMNSPLPMKPFNRNTLFAAIDLDRTFIERPRIIQKLLKETNLFFKKGLFKPFPCKSFPASQAVEAFQFMARSQHIGKIMLTFDQQTVHGNPLTAPQKILHGECSYLITGGLSGFGLAAAQWMADNGAKHLILIGRKGAASQDALEMIKQLKNEGVCIKVASVDVTNIEQLGNLFTDCNQEMPPIKGVIHSAMVLQDAFIHQLTPQSIQQVLLPKMVGCLNLHQLTSKYPLDFFILFSSISSIIGNPGQGNYAAANAFLDSFCYYRKSLGLPALTINWGALNIGALTRNTKIAAHLNHHGIKAISPKIALELLKKALSTKECHLCALDIDWQKMMEAMPAIKKSFVFEDFFSEKHNASPQSVLLEELRSLDENGQFSLITNRIKEIVAKALKIDPNALEISTRLNILGVDSLMAMELQAMMEVRFGVKIPTLELMKGPTIKQLAEYLRRNL
jgi:acyl transferase domain-containing protein/NADPH:quinone reductase-like Zn-dependent oxidoreductase/acyl carrier protein